MYGAVTTSKEAPMRGEGFDRRIASVDSAGMKMDFDLNILTLNCWGLIGVSRHRRERMAGIASHIASSNYDFVFLQEVWSKKDFEMICKKTASVLPYSHYFYSGVVGSGVCLLSRCQIVDAAQYKFSLNGFAHKVLHGDWFAGKVVGLCKVIYHGIKINLYVTHLHASYDSLHDQYLPHRVAQAFELSQFVKLTSESCDLCILAGDFNTEPHDVSYQLIMHNVGCSDSFLTASVLKSKDAECATCGHPENPYTTQQELNDSPAGKRIDYIMYKCGKGVSVKCVSCETPLGKIPNTSLPYSDHEAVVSQLHVSKCSSNGNFCEGDPKAKMEALIGGHNILAKSMQELRISRLIYVVLAFICSAVIILTYAFKLPGGYSALLEVVQVMCTVIVVFSFWMGVMMHKMEYNSLLACSTSMQVLINALGEDSDTESIDSTLKLNSFD